MIYHQRGFTLIELVIFILVTSITVTALLLSFQTTLLKTPVMHYELIANQLADQCMEGFVGERRLNSYSNSALACSATPPLPSVCTTQTGYTVSAVISCTPTLSGDTATSETVTVTVTGLGQATLTMLLADY